MAKKVKKIIRKLAKRKTISQASYEFSKSGEKYSNPDMVGKNTTLTTRELVERYAAGGHIPNLNTGVFNETHVPNPRSLEPLDIHNLKIEYDEKVKKLSGKMDGIARDVRKIKKDRKEPKKESSAE